MRLRASAEDKARNLGATTNEEIAELLGIGTATLDRWRKGATNIGLNKARYAADRLGLTVDTAFERM